MPNFMGGSSNICRCYCDRRLSLANVPRKPGFGKRDFCSGLCVFRTTVDFPASALRTNRFFKRSKPATMAATTLAA
jgi:hypothetical protein